jgi:hypothetical protein
MFPGLGPTTIPWNYIFGCLAHSQLLAELSLSTEHSKKVCSTRPGFGVPTHIVQLHLVILIRVFLFLWEACCVLCFFRCLLLNCLSHTKWCHLCHCSSYTKLTRKVKLAFRNCWVPHVPDHSMQKTRHSHTHTLHHKVPWQMWPASVPTLRDRARFTYGFSF